MIQCAVDWFNRCVPAISVTNPKFTSIEDTNADGYICMNEIENWVQGKYGEAVGRALFSACDNFDKMRAIESLKGVRAEMTALIHSLSGNLYFDCPEDKLSEAIRFLQASISRSEKNIINYAIPAAADKGAGQLGLSWYADSGIIAAIRRDSDSARSGLMVGDKIVSVDGFQYKDTVDYKQNSFFSWMFWFGWNLDTYDRMQAHGTSANSLFFGPCGSTATVEIERNGQKTVLDVKRGTG